MISPDLVAHMVHTISWYRTWIDVLDFNTYGETAILDASNRVITIRCKVLRLEVRVSKFGFQRFQVLSLPERAIEDAISQLSTQLGFRTRVKELKLMYSDINKIIEIASEGAIQMELEDY